MLREAILTAFILVDVAHTIRDKRRKNRASESRPNGYQYCLGQASGPYDTLQVIVEQALPSFAAGMTGKEQQEYLQQRTLQLQAAAGVSMGSQARQSWMLALVPSGHTAQTEADMGELQTAGFGLLRSCSCRSGFLPASQAAVCCRSLPAPRSSGRTRWEQNLWLQVMQDKGVLHACTFRSWRLSCLLTL